MNVSGALCVALFALGSAVAALHVRAQELADEAGNATMLEARRLLDARRPKEAFERLAPLEAELAGRADYDYLYGIAALDSGARRDAVFALERVVAAEPEFLGARMELGRALYELGELDLARAQFAWLAAQNPPPATGGAIERYLAAIDGDAGGTRSRFSGLLQFGAGHDSNANASTADDAFLGFTLNPANVETSSGFGELLAGVGHTLAIGRDRGLVSSLQASHRTYPDASFVDQSVASAGISYLHRLGSWRGSFGVNGTYGWLDGDDHDVTANVDLGLARRLATSWEVALNARAGRQQYEEEALEVLDIDRYVGGVSLTRLDLGERAGRLGVALLGGRDDARRDGSPYGNDRLGARLFGGLLLRPRSSLYADLAWQETDYGDSDFFGQTRRDEQWSAQLAFEFQNWPAAQWNVSPRVRFIDHDSTVSLYDYDRTEFALFVRRSF
jgi:tetratricopeptide (TPR) repeat protein